MLDLDRVEALANAATPGPWGYKAGVLKHYAFSTDTGEDFGISLQEMHWEDGREVPAAANAQFIAAAREAVPALVAELRAARAALATVTAERDQLRGILVATVWAAGGCAAPEVSVEFLAHVPDEVRGIVRDRDTALCAMGEAQDGIEKLATALGVTDYVCSIGPLLAEIERLRTAAAAKAGASFDSCDCPACQFMRRKPERTAADERADVVAMFRARSKRWRESDTSIGQTVSRLYGESAIEVEQGAHVGAAKGGER